jgi:hypothetical protein
MQKEELVRCLRIAQEQVARVKGVTSLTGLDVFAANDKVKQQQVTIKELREEVWLRLTPQRIPSPCSLLKFKL